VSLRSKTVEVTKRRCVVCGVSRYVPKGKREPCPYKALHRGGAK